jgi:small subunit ribosomal protein S27Ae
MQVFVANPSGPSKAYDVSPTTTVGTLKSMIENREFIPSHLIRLVNGTDLVDTGTLISNGVDSDDTLDLMLDIPAGMRKKWRKKRMRRLRRKRRKMRQRAR